MHVVCMGCYEVAARLGSFMFYCSHYSLAASVIYVPMCVRCVACVCVCVFVELNVSLCILRVPLLGLFITQAFIPSVNVVSMCEE